MDKTRRELVTGGTAALSAALLLPLAGCDSPPSGPQSVEQIEFTPEDAKTIRDGIARRLQLLPQTPANEIGRLLFSIRPEERPERLDVQGPLMRVYMEFYANNLPNVLTKYGVQKIPDQVLVEKRKALLDSLQFKAHIIRYCARNHGRNPALAGIVSQLYVLQPGALSPSPSTDQAGHARIARARNEWIGQLVDAPDTRLQELAKRLTITNRFEVGTQTGFVLEVPTISVQ